MKTKLALFGAAGKMGTRISRRLQNSTEFQTLYVEAGDAAQAALRQRGLEPSDPHTAASQADVLVLAIPDKLIGKVSQEMVPLMKPGAMMILLDPAAPYGGELPSRPDITYFVTHPCHPPVVNDEIDPEARDGLFRRH